jgi:hypothetical protein
LALFQKILFYILTFCVGALFVYSAYTKYLTIQNFEYTLAETNLMSFGVANVLARILLIAETIIGLLFILNINFNKKLYIFAVWLLVFFNLYLMWVMHQYGISGNCGCFGEVVKMTPMQAIIKNIALIIAIYYLSCFRFSFEPWQKLLVFILPIVGIFWLTPPEFIFISEPDTILNQTVSLDEMYGANASNKPSFDYHKGKYIICVMSTTCHHCKSAARKLSTMYKRNHSLPLFAVYAGDSASLQTFFTESKAQIIPHQLQQDYTFINRLTSYGLEPAGFPKVLWMQDGKLVRISKNYFTINQSAIEQWMKTP